MLTAKDIHEMYAMNHLHAKPWDEVSLLAKRLYGAIARELNREISSIETVKCPVCHEMVDAYAYNEHFCAKTSNPSYCWTNEPGHILGWFCPHPDCLNAEEHSCASGEVSQAAPLASQLD